MNEEFTDCTDNTIFALCLYGECRGESLESQVAHANVIWNRHKLWKQPLKDVILKPKQFSCFNEGDPNRVKILAILYADDVKDHDYWQVYWVAYGVMFDYLKNNIGRCCHYNTIDCDPKWDDNMRLFKVIGNTEFFEEIV